MRLNTPIRNDTWASDLEGTVLLFPVHRSGDDGHEFIIPSSWAADAEHANIRIQELQRDCPSYLDGNPVIRIARVKLIAVKMDD